MGDIISGRMTALPDFVDDIVTEKELLNQKVIILNEHFYDSLDEIKNFINISRWKLTNLCYRIQTNNVLWDSWKDI